MIFDSARWPNFTQDELSCHCGCGLFIRNDKALDALQALRIAMGAPLTVNSATRCPRHNAAEGGKPASAHLTGKGFDIKIGEHDRAVLLDEAERAGFTGFGFGLTILHVDVGRKRQWDYGTASREAWRGIMP